MTGDKAKAPRAKRAETFLVGEGDQQRGPFGLDFIEGMIMSGVYPADVLVRREGSRDWQAFSAVRQGGLPPILLNTSGSPAADDAQPQAGDGSGRTVGIVVAVLVGGLIIGLVLSSGGGASSGTRSSPTAPQTQTDILPDEPSSSHGAVGSTSPAPSSPRAAAGVAVAQNGFTRPAAYAGSTPYSGGSYAAPVQTSPPVRVAPSQTGEEVTTMVFEGKTYSLPRSEYLRLLPKKLALDTQSSRLDQTKAFQDLEKGRIESSRMSITSALQSLEFERSGLNRYNQYSVDLFNQKLRTLQERERQLNEQVKNFNRDIRSYNDQINSYNADVDAFNAELARVGRLVR